MIPNTFDILLGRTKLAQECFGNLRYRNLIASHQDAYDKALKVEKTTIANQVLQTVKGWNGRFLTEYYADYVQVNDTKVRKC